MASGMQSCALSGASTSMPLTPEVCATMVPGRTAEVAARPETSAGQLGVRHGQQQQLGVAGDVGYGRHRGVGQPALGALARRAGYGAAGHHDMVDAFQRDTQRGSHPAGGDDPHLEPGRAQSVELHHRRRPSQVSWFRSSPAKRVPDGRQDSTATMALDGAVVFASVFAAPATAALGRGGLQPRQQFGDRLTTGWRLLGFRERIGAAMASVGRRWR